jgi:hypothetical protein
MKKILLLGLLALSVFGIERPNIVGEWDRAFIDDNVVGVICKSGVNEYTQISKDYITYVFTDKEIYLITTADIIAYKLSDCEPARLKNE